MRVRFVGVTGFVEMEDDDELRGDVEGARRFLVASVSIAFSDLGATLSVAELVFTGGRAEGAAAVADTVSVAATMLIHAATRRSALSFTSAHCD